MFPLAPVLNIGDQVRLGTSANGTWDAGSFSTFAKGCFALLSMFLAPHRCGSVDTELINGDTDA